MTELIKCLNIIKELNEKEKTKKIKKYNLKEENKEEEKESYLIKKYLNEKNNFEYRNRMKLKSLRLEKEDKYYQGTEDSFFEKMNIKIDNIFKKKWTQLNRNLKIIKINEYFEKNKINNIDRNKIKKMLDDKKLKNEVVYDEENGIIIEIKIN